jgi:hypothetical protein|tara:strand:- start:271 stop:549 length:279 start_codon:yes stop_codon:yes gene_type:complete
LNHSLFLLLSQFLLLFSLLFLMPVLRPQPLLSLLLFLCLELGLSSLNFCLLSSTPLLLELFVFLGFPLLFHEGRYLFALLLIPSLHFLLLEL